MRVRIDFEATDPPQGRIGRDGDEAVGFVGWLGLVTVMEQMLAAPDRSGIAQGR